MKARELLFPIQYFENNLLWNRYDKSCWACFKLEGFGYEYKSIDEKMMALDKVARFIASIGTRAQILMIPVSMDIQQHFDRIRQEYAGNELALAHADATEEYIYEVTEGISNDYEIFVLTMLRKPSVGQTPSEIIKNIWELGKSRITADDALIAQSDIKAFTRQARVWFESQNRRLALEPVDTETVQWLLKRMMYRGETFVPLRRNINSQWQPASSNQTIEGRKYKRPHENDILTLFEDKITSHDKCVEIEHPNGEKNYQAFLAVAHLPSGFVFPGSEWLTLLNIFDFGVETCINIDTVEYQQAMKQIRDNTSEIKGQMAHASESGEEVPDELYENREDTDGLRDHLKAHNDPLVVANFLFCIADKDLNVVNEKANQVIDFYEDWEFKVERPFENQLDMFYDFIPGTPRYMKDYVHKLTPEAVASSMFPAKRRLGDNVGHYIGTMDDGKPVFFRPEEAIKRNQSASGYFSGTLGGGKSFNANLIGYLVALYGGRLLVIDPKGDRDKWEATLTEFAGDINVTNLTNSEADRGKLDPFIIYKDNMDDAKYLALNMVSELYGIKPQSEMYTILNERIDFVATQPRPSMQLLIKALLEVDDDDPLVSDARSLARKMNIDRKVGMSSLFYGRGDEQGLSFEKKINILQISNLKLPAPNKMKEDYDLEERVSMAIMMPIASFAIKFEDSDRSTFKAIIFDESWALNRSSVGRALMEGGARKGRSYNTALFFIGQSVSDVPNEGVAEAITYKFAFKVKTTDEAKRVLAWLGLEESEDNIEALKRLPNGCCFFRDLDGNVDRLHFDVGVAGHLLEAFESNPTAEINDDEDEMED